MANDFSIVHKKLFSNYRRCIGFGGDAGVKNADQSDEAHHPTFKGVIWNSIDYYQFKMMRLN